MLSDYICSLENWSTSFDKSNEKFYKIRISVNTGEPVAIVLENTIKNKYDGIICYSSYGETKYLHIEGKSLEIVMLKVDVRLNDLGYKIDRIGY